MQIERHIPSAYVLYEKKAVSDVVENGLVENFYSKNDLRTGIMEFNVEGNSEHLLVPSETYLRVVFELSGQKVSGTGDSVTVTRIEDGGKCSVVNNIFGSAFESVEVYVNSKNITKSDKHNQYNSYLQTLCNYGSDSLGTYFELSGWAKDTSGKMDDVDQVDNKGLKARRDIFKGKPLRAEFIGKLCHPLFSQTKVLPTQVSLRIIIRKGNDRFMLMHEVGEYELKIVEAVLMMQKVQVTPGLKDSYTQMMGDGHAIPYFLKTPSVNYYTIEKDSSQFMRDDLFLGKMPRRIIIGMVETEAYHGKRDKNPFNFQDFGISELGLYKDGVPYPRPVMKMDFAADRYAEAYHNFMTSLNAAYSRFVPMVSKAEYKNGFTLFSFDMSPDQLGSMHPGSMLNLNSNIRLEMKFKVPLAQNITLLVYSEIEHLMEMHRDRRVSVDF
jgi:hypothetical protein